MSARQPQPNQLSGWALPPPAARASGDVQPVRCWDSAEAAMAFLSLLPPSFAPARDFDEAGLPI